MQLFRVLANARSMLAEYQTLCIHLLALYQIRTAKKKFHYQGGVTPSIFSELLFSALRFGKIHQHFFTASIQPLF